MLSCLFILHPHQLVCQSVANHLSAIGYDARSSGPTVEEAVLTARQTPPDIALIDSGFDEGHGFEAAHLSLLANPQTRVILCLPPAPGLLQMAIQTDASGYLPADFDLPELETCLQRIQDRFRYISPTFAKLLSLPIPTADPAVVEKINKLTSREKDYLRLICRGLMQKEMADQLGVKESAVVSMKKILANKLGLNSRRDLPYFIAPYLSILDN